jgi:hypothetical protein
LLCASSVFIGTLTGNLTFLSANSDNPYWGYDFFTLPRCGLALITGLDIAGSSQRIAYGPWATDWASHPLMCALFGAPLGGLFSPHASYLLAVTLFFAVHIYCLVFYLKKSGPSYESAQTRSERVLHHLFAFLIGGYAPFIVIYHYGQYHALSILAVFLLMQGRRAQVLGFVLSALTKPLLAPAGLLLIIRRQWSQVVWITIFAAIGTLPWALMDALGIIKSVGSLGPSGMLMLKYSIMDWAQELSLAKPMEHWVSPEINFVIRLIIGALQLLSALLIAHRGDLKVGFCIAILVFFTVYGRGHEYHAVTLVPFFLYLFTERGNRHRRWAFVGIVSLFALPTTYALVVHGFGGNGATIATMKESSPVLGWLFVLQRPVAILGFWVYLLRTEWILDPLQSSGSKPGGGVCSDSQDSAKPRYDQIEIGSAATHRTQ